MIFKRIRDFYLITGRWDKEKCTGGEKFTLILFLREFPFDFSQTWYEYEGTWCECCGIFSDFSYRAWKIGGREAL